MPPHVLTLKNGVPIILLRNINPPRPCNGTKLPVKKIMNNIIEATIFNGKFKEEDKLLARITLISTDMPFEFKRLQFPVRLAFAMIINKAHRYKCVNKIWKIHAFHMDNCMWLAHTLDSLPIYSSTHQKEKQKILYIQKLFNKHN
jgi:hypothetical protein